MGERRLINQGSLNGESTSNRGKGSGADSPLAAVLLNEGMGNIFRDEAVPLYEASLRDLGLSEVDVVKNSKELRKGPVIENRLMAVYAASRVPEKFKPKENRNSGAVSELQVASSVEISE